MSDYDYRNRILNMYRRIIEEERDTGFGGLSQRGLPNNIIQDYGYVNHPSPSLPQSTYDGLSMDQKTAIFQEDIDNRNKYAKTHNYPGSSGRDRLTMKEKDYNVPIARNQHVLSQLPERQEMVGYRPLPNASIRNEDNNYLPMLQREKEIVIGKEMDNPVGSGVTGGKKPKKVKNPAKVAKGKEAAKSNPWIKYVMAIAKKHGVNYAEALKIASRQKK